MVNPIHIGISLMVAALLGLLGAQTVRLAGAKADLATEQRERAEERTLAAEVAASGIAAARDEGERRWRAQKEIADDAQLQVDRERVARAAADRAAGGLRAAATAAAARCRAGGDHSAASAASTTAADPGMVLADVLGRLEQRGRELAALAGERGIAGTACERAYDALGAAATGR